MLGLHPSPMPPPPRMARSRASRFESGIFFSVSHLSPLLLLCPVLSPSLPPSHPHSVLPMLALPPSCTLVPTLSLMLRIFRSGTWLRFRVISRPGITSLGSGMIAKRRRRSGTVAATSSLSSKERPTDRGRKGADTERA